MMMFFAAQSRLANFDNSAPRRPAIAEANFCAWLCGPPPPSPLLLLLLSSLSIVVGKSESRRRNVVFLYTIFRGLLSLLLLVVVKMIKMKLKNKSDLFVRLCYWPGLEECSSRPGSVCDIVSRVRVLSGIGVSKKSNFYQHKTPQRRHL